MKRIVIVGGGFGGVYTAKYILNHIKKEDDVEVVLLNDKNYFLFTPLLHEVATGGLNRHHVVVPIREILKSSYFTFVCTKAKHIDFKKKVVLSDSGPISYDYLVVASGSKTAYYGTEGAEKYSIPLKTLENAAHIRNHVISECECAAQVKASERNLHLTFVVVGGGPTGVELAGELSQFLDQLATLDFKEFSRKDISIKLVHRGDKIMQQFPEALGRKAQRKLGKLGVEIMLNASVERITANQAHVKIGSKVQKIDTHSVFWTAGVESQKVGQKPDVTDDNNCFVVDDYLQVKGLDQVYSLGDCALFRNSGEDKPIPRLAQATQKASPYVGHNILADIRGGKKKAFVFKEAGLLVSVGKCFAVGQIGWFSFSGFSAWWLWRTVYLFKMIGWYNRFQIAYEWTLNLFFRRDTSQI